MLLWCFGLSGVFLVVSCFRICAVERRDLFVAVGLFIVVICGFVFWLFALDCWRMLLVAG